MASSPSPDLQVICKKLASNSPNQLLQSLPSLVNHVIRSKQALSASQESKSSKKGGAAETSMLVHKLKSHITTLIQSHNKVGRFVAISLIKAAVDVGGWEVLQGSETWVRELLSVVQKGDPLASKELAIAALTKIYVLIHPYQTLNREIATKTIPAFATACVQLLKSAASDDASLDTLNTTEVICDSLSTLIPLYPATLRPFSSQTQTAVRKFLAPTLSDSIFISESLQHAARRVVILQHFVAAKTGGSDEWLKNVTFVLNELHSTADQVLRAVDEAWTPSDGSSRGAVDLEAEPHGGGSAPNHLTPWSGIQAGTQRVIGLLQYTSDCLSFPTKGQVAVPLAKIMDAASRLCLIARLSPKTQSWDQSVQTRAAVGRDEKEELWSAIPDIHVAVLQVFRTVIQRFEKDTLPLVPEILDHIARVFNSAVDNDVIRTTVYQTLKDVLSIAGPTLSKSTVDMLSPIVGACCRDLQEDAGHLKQSKPVQNTGETKKNGVAVNTDLFLQKPQDAAGPQPLSLHPRHKAAALALLASLLAKLPQQHLKPSLRSLLDQTAILTQNRDAMLASVLNPYLDPKGRRYPSLLPHLTQQFPQDPSLDILRTNLRTDVGAPVVDQTTLDEEDEAVDDVDEDMGEDEQDVDDDTGMDVDDEAAEGGAKTSSFPVATHISKEIPVQSNPFGSAKAEKPVVASANAFGDVKPRAASPPKRRHEGASPAQAKRRELGDSAPVRSAPVEAADEDDDSDESVHLNMELEDDEDEDEDEDE